MKVDLGNRVALSGLVVYTIGNYDPEYKSYSIEDFQNYLVAGTLYCHSEAYWSTNFQQKL